MSGKVREVRVLLIITQAVRVTTRAGRKTHPFPIKLQPFSTIGGGHTRNETKLAHGSDQSLQKHHYHYAQYTVYQVPTRYQVVYNVLPLAHYYQVKLLNPFRAAVPFWGQTTQFSSSLFPKRDCGSKGVKPSCKTSVVLLLSTSSLRADRRLHVRGGRGRF